MDIDLSSLETTDEEGGQPLEVLLTAIDEDPDQPRVEFSKSAMQELVASIKERGVKTPISLREHPTDPDRWIINHGARRFRASLEAGLSIVPSFVDSDYNGYDQVIENIQRDELKPMEIALFIKRKIDEGDKAAKIGNLLGKSKSFITEHLSLIDMPPTIKQAFEEERCRSPSVVYLLTKLHGKDPADLDAWIPLQADITRAVLARYKKEDKAEEGGSGGEPSESTKLPTSNPTPQKPISSGIRNALLVLNYDGREANADLKTIPSKSGLIHIVYEDGTRDEVLAQDCKIISLLDSSS